MVKVKLSFAIVMGMAFVSLSAVFAATLSPKSETGAVLQVRQRPQVVKNPYAGIDWEQVNQYLGNFHSHTLYSDGRAEPDELIYMYADAGYSILAIADHDNGYRVREGERDPGRTHETTWPWTRWIDEKPSQVRVHERFDMETSAYYPDLGENGMLAVRGNELSQHPHIVSLFNDCGFPTRDETERRRLLCVEAKGGISYWAHPAAYIPPERWAGIAFESSFEAAVAYFGNHLIRYNSNVGIEFTQGRWPLTIELWDALLQEHYKEHDIFIIGNDDNHHTRIDHNATLTIVLAAELTEEAVKGALERGQTFVGKRVDTYPQFNRIEVDEDQNRIVVNIDNHDGIVWIKNGQVYHEGDTIDYSDMSDAVLRFEVKAGNNIFMSQAFLVL